MDVETLVLHQRKIKARHKRPWSFILVLLFAAASVSMSASVAGDDETANEMKRLSGRSPRSANPTMYDDSVQSYLSQFGYLPASQPGVGNLRSDYQLKEAVKNLQRYANLPVTGVMDNATLSLMSKPRCGLPDTPSPLDGRRYRMRRRRRFILEGRKWDHTDLTWSLRTDPIRHYDRGKVRRQLSRALEVWTNHSRLTFRYVDSDEADILVYFERGNHEDGYPFDGRGQILAHAFFPGSGRGGDVHFDIEEDWLVDDVIRTERDEDKIPLYKVAKHEFGHALGLSHSSVFDSLMFPWYKQDTQLGEYGELGADDVHGIRSLYGAKETKIWERNPYAVPRFPTTTTTEPPDTPRPNIPPNDPYIPPYPARPSYPHIPRRPQPDSPDHRNKHPNQLPESPSKRPPHTSDRPEKSPDRTPFKYPNLHPKHPERPRETPESRDVPRTTPRVREGIVDRDSNPDKPDTCDTNYDAIAVIRNELFVFKDKWMWRIGDTGVLDGYPALIQGLWSALPKDSKIDAVYETVDKSNYIVFFIGRQFFAFQGNNLLRGYPRPLTDLGLPTWLDHIDGAMVWGHNSATYLFAGSRYWKIDNATGKVELDYPRDMSTWRGIEYDIDDAFQWKDGATYFFKGKGFWKFNDLRMKVEKTEQSPSAQFWMKCPQVPTDKGSGPTYSGDWPPGDNSGRTHGGKYFPGGPSSGHRSASAYVAMVTLLSCAVTVIFVI